MIRIALITLLLGIATPAVAADVGTCLTDSGTRLAPWTDPVDPACGEDCGVADDEPQAALCSTEDGTCGADELAAVLEMPEPTGPRCIEPGPSCHGGDSTSAGVASGVIALAPRPDPTPAPSSATLPGAGPPVVDARPWTRSEPPTAPPPRA